MQQPFDRLLHVAMFDARQPNLFTHFHWFAWTGDDIPDWRAPNALRRGDLVFWKGHVGIMTDADHLLHANAWHMAVAVEPLESAITRIANYYAEPIGARRIDISSKRGRTPDWLSVSA